MLFDIPMQYYINDHIKHKYCFTIYTNFKAGELVCLNMLILGTAGSNFKKYFYVE